MDRASDVVRGQGEHAGANRRTEKDHVQALRRAEVALGGRGVNNHEVIHLLAQVGHDGVHVIGGTTHKRARGNDGAVAHHHGAAGT